MSGLCGAGDPTQDFEHSRQALCQLSYTANLEEANSLYLELCLLEIQDPTEC